MRASLKLVFINIIVFFLLFNAVIWLICAGNSIYNIFDRSEKFDKAAVEAKLPHYANVSWAETYFREAKLRETEYVSYIGWRNKPFSGKTITISGPYGQRRTVGQADPAKPTVYFFGGSSMWGTGVDDASTIPSLFTKISGFASENFGQTGYTAHQGLILLIQLLEDGRRPDIVVFYDGGNDVTNKCRVELTPWSHEREARIASALKAYRKQETQYNLSYLIKPLKAMAERFVATPAVRRLNIKSPFNCDIDPSKAQKIADNLIEDWMMAKRLVESYNGKFFGMLQPVSYFSRTLDHDMSETHKAQFEAVYPLIKEKMANRPELYDLTHALDRNEYIYTDFAHLGPSGNKYIADDVSKILGKSILQPTGGAGTSRVIAGPPN